MNRPLDGSGIFDFEHAAKESILDIRMDLGKQDGLDSLPSRGRLVSFVDSRIVDNVRLSALRRIPR